MKHTVMLSLTLAAALPLFADEAKTTESKEKTAKTATSDQTAKPAETPAAEQSPLVAAAKRSNRLGKKSSTKVITNDTLKTSGGSAHVTTSDKVVPLPTPPNDAPRPTPDMIADAKKAEQKKRDDEAAAKAKIAEDERQRRIEAMAGLAEEQHPDDVDAAEAEQALQEAHEKKKGKPPHR